MINDFLSNLSNLDGAIVHRQSEPIVVDGQKAEASSGYFASCDERKTRRYTWKKGITDIYRSGHNGSRERTRAEGDVKGRISGRWLAGLP
jgi:hypothetical protein